MLQQLDGECGARESGSRASVLWCSGGQCVGGKGGVGCCLKKLDPGGKETHSSVLFPISVPCPLFIKQGLLCDCT